MTEGNTPPRVVVGTSGSTDYLNDTGDRRFWPVHVLSEEPLPPNVGDDGLSCDGLHDEGAPAHYLCSRCFPGFPNIGGDLLGPQDDDDDDFRRDDNE
jgi:hypothetical protein